MNQTERLLVLLLVWLLGKGARVAEGSVDVCLMTNAWQKWEVCPLRLWNLRDAFGTHTQSHDGASQCSTATCRMTGSWTAGGNSTKAKEQSWLSSLPPEVAATPRYEGDIPCKLLKYVFRRFEVLLLILGKGRGLSSRGLLTDETGWIRRLLNILTNLGQLKDKAEHVSDLNTNMTQV